MCGSEGTASLCQMGTIENILKQKYDTEERVANVCMWKGTKNDN